MLSTDILTQFRDRSDEIRVNPLSFAEVYENYQGDKRGVWRDYYTYAGDRFAGQDTGFVPKSGGRKGLHQAMGRRKWYSIYRH
jgi:hypothetical protein